MPASATITDARFDATERTLPGSHQRPKDKEDGGDKEGEEKHDPVDAEPEQTKPRDDDEGGEDWHPGVGRKPL